MKALDNLKMGPKLISAFLLVSFFTVFVGIFAIVQMRAMDEMDLKLYERMTVPIGQLADVRDAFQRIRVNMRDAIMTGDAAHYGARIEELKALADTASTEFKKTLLTEDGQAHFKKLEEDRAAFRVSQVKIVSLVAAGKRGEAETLMRGDSVRQAAEVNKGLQILMDLKLKLAKEASGSNSAAAASAVTGP